MRALLICAALATALTACKAQPSEEDAGTAAMARGVLVRHCPGSSDIVVRDTATGRLILHRAWESDRFLDQGVAAKDAC